MNELLTDVKDRAINKILISRVRSQKPDRKAM